MRILYLCDADGGGIAEYAIRQVEALEAQGAEVTFLCRRSFAVQRVTASEIRAILPGQGFGKGAAPIRLLRRIRDTRGVARIAAEDAERDGYDVLLIACYAEYFSPFWAAILKRAARAGLRVGSIAHDPVRDFVLGPLWWHRWSVKMAYSFVSDVFVHDLTPVDFGGCKPVGSQVHVIPHGPYEVAEARGTREELRKNLGFTDSDQVYLAFGQIRDGKNLDRFMRAMVHLPPEVKLLVAGRGDSDSQRPPAAYQRLAEDLGIGDRCRWEIRYVPDEETGDLFAASDYVLVTYSAKFRSASGVLNAAVSCRKPVLASSGPGPLKTAVEDYQLGWFVPPDNDAAILEGARRLIVEPGQPEWERYERENSWEENARRVIAAFHSR
jgi:glycosyltransferase involved in cell wall biosynthesis